MAEASTSSTSSPQPIQGFARFFRGYALSLSLIVASVPVLSGYFDLIPFFASTKAFLTGLTSLGSYLIVAFIFFQRLSLAGLYFPLRKLDDRRIAYSRELRRIRLFSFVPGILTLSALVMFLFYILAINYAVKEVAYQYGVLDDGTPLVQIPPPGKYERKHARLPLINNATVDVSLETRQGQLSWDVQFPNQQTVRAIREATPDVAQPLLVVSSGLFLLAFVFAVSAFILMGLKDYLQEQLGIPDGEILSVVVTEQQRFYVDELQGKIYGTIEYSSDAPELPPLISGPFCIWDDLPPEPADFDLESGKVIRWRHKRPGETPDKIPCNFNLAINPGVLDSLFRAAADGWIGARRRVASRAVQSSA